MIRKTLSVILAAAAVSCTVEPAVDYEYSVGEALPLVTEGIGTQFDLCYLEPSNHTDTDWELISRAVEDVNLQAIRLRFYPEMYERANDNADPFFFDSNSPDVDFNSSEMQHLYKVLDLMEKNHVNVDLSWYGCRTTFLSEDGKYSGSWMGGRYGEDGINCWMVAPSARYVENPVEEYAEAVAAGLNHLINEKGYTCIYEFSIFPEPEGVIGDMDMYGKICASIEKRLIAASIADKVKFSGPADYNNNPEILNEKYLSHGFPYEKVTSSVYKFHGSTDMDKATTQTPSSNPEMLEFGKSFTGLCASKGMSWGVAECGTSNFKTAISNYDTETFDRALTMFRFFVNMTNAGCTNMKYFIFSDNRYDSAMNTLGLFRHRSLYYPDSTADYQGKPLWYSWGLLMKYTDQGSVIHPVTDSYPEGSDENICITALNLPDGSWTYAMANLGTEDKTVSIYNPDAPKTMKLYPAAEEGRTELAMVSPLRTLRSRKGKFTVTIPASSYLVLSNKK